MHAHTRRRTGVVIALSLALAALAAVLLAGGSRAANAAFPGKNGRIVFNDRSGYLVLVNPDGTGLVRLARTQAADYAIGASFSPDGNGSPTARRAGAIPTSSSFAPTGAQSARSRSHAASTSTPPGRATGPGSRSRRTGTATPTSTRSRPTVPIRSS